MLKRAHNAIVGVVKIFPALRHVEPFTYTRTVLGTTIFDQAANLSGQNVTFPRLIS